MSTSSHPQTDGSSEIKNRMVKILLKFYSNLERDDWDTLLTAAEFSSNSVQISRKGMSPFEVDLGWNPKSSVDFLIELSLPNECTI